MISYIGLGSNLGSRKSLIDQAVAEIHKIKGVEVLKTSYTYENPAVTTKESKFDWDKTYLNSAIKIKCAKEFKPQELLIELKMIEKKLGRENNIRWSARPIDLDILSIEGISYKSDTLEVPHKELETRNFVTAPLRDIAPNLKINGRTSLELNRAQKHPLPIWMGIANVTPDSFSDGGNLNNTKSFEEKLSEWTQTGVHIIDLGAESTRPGAQALNVEEEILRLRTPLSILKERQSQPRLPMLSLDSRNFETLKFALDYNLKIINDVSGLTDPKVLDLLADSDCDYVLMHSLSVPADPIKILDTEDDTNENILRWLEGKLEMIDKKNISLDRIIFDPGIGFGKSSLQSIEVIRSIKKYKKKGLRLLAGHSRKSFMKNFTSDNAPSRDFESIGLSLALAEQGVDFLRVHSPESHIKAHLGFTYAHTSYSN